MQARIIKAAAPALMLGLFAALPAAATTFSFSTGDPDGRIATGSRPESAAKIEIETGDDFILGSSTAINSATFTGLLTGGATTADIGQVRVEIYRVFPKDSDTARTPNVVTRVNSPSDVEFADRDTAAGNLSFTTNVLAASFTAANSVLNGINKFPSQHTGGEGAVTGQEVKFDVSFASPFLLPADHYFLVPQVEVAGPDGEFLWLSAPKPITGGTGPFVGDLQSWIRNEDLAPDWSRIGTDIVGGTPAPTFNAAFSLDGAVLPEPGSLSLLGAALAGIGFFRLRRRDRRG